MWGIFPFCTIHHVLLFTFNTTTILRMDNDLVWWLQWTLKRFLWRTAFQSSTNFFRCFFRGLVDFTLSGFPCLRRSFWHCNWFSGGSSQHFSVLWWGVFGCCALPIDRIWCEARLKRSQRRNENAYRVEQRIELVTGRRSLNNCLRKNEGE